MRTFLKNWNVVKSGTNPHQLVVISDWTLTGKMVKLIRTENVYNNGVITESIAYHEVVVGTPNPSIVNAIIPLPIPWYQLPLDHQTTIMADEASILTDEESNDTIRATVI